MFFFLSSGRVHSANVSGVDFVGQNVTVEWFEFGETKGKEVNKSYSIMFFIINKFLLLFVDCYLIDVFILGLP